VKREIAQEIIESMKGMDKAIDRLTTAVRAMGDEEESERRRMLGFIANLITDLHVHVTLPTLKDHPELHPDFPDGSFRWKKGKDGEEGYEWVKRAIEQKQRE